MERQLIEEYRTSVSDAVSKLTAEQLALTIELASLPEHIRGFGHVKLESVHRAKARWRQIERALNASSADMTADKKAA